MVWLEIRQIVSSPVELFLKKSELRKIYMKTLLHVAGKIIFQTFIGGVLSGLHLDNEGCVLKHLSVYFA